MDFVICVAIASMAAIGVLVRDDCRRNDELPYRFFASKTSYDRVRGAFDGRVELPGGCRANHFYYLGRHGSRFPPPHDSRLMREYLPRLREDISRYFRAGRSLTDECVATKLERWISPFGSNRSGLTSQGKKEQTQIAQRYRIRFPSLFGNNSRYDIRYMRGKRIVSSLRRFLKGLLDEEASGSARLVRDDELLFFDENCPEWDATSLRACESKNAKYASENAFSSLSRRLGYRKTLPFKEVEIIYNACRYETSWFPNATSPWCDLFTNDELIDLEYEKDRDFFCRYGYEHPINYQLACPLLEDLVNNIRNVTENDSPSVALRFTHSGGIMKFFSRMGFFNDSRSIYGADYKKRRWRTSFMDPFSSNLAIVVVKCDDKLKLLSYLQENEFRLPACKEWPCDLQQFLDHYENIADACDVRELCGE